MYIQSLFYATETPSSCHISSVKEGDPTNITCTFSSDVYATKSDIKIFRFADDDDNEGNFFDCHLGLKFVVLYPVNNVFRVAVGSRNIFNKIPKFERS